MSKYHTQISISCRFPISYIPRPRNPNSAWGSYWARGPQGGLRILMGQGDHNGASETHVGPWNTREPGVHKEACRQHWGKGKINGAWGSQWGPGTTTVGPRDGNEAQGPERGLGITMGAWGPPVGQGPQWGPADHKGPRDHIEVL